MNGRAAGRDRAQLMLTWSIKLLQQSSGVLIPDPEALLSPGTGRKLD